MARAGRSTVSILIVLALLGGALAFMVAGQLGAQAQTVPDGLFADLTRINRKLTKLIDDERTKGLDRAKLIGRVKEIEFAKLEMVDEFFDQPVYGVPFNEVFRKLDCLDQQLKLGTGIQIGKGAEAASQDLIADTFEKGKRCKEKLEEKLRAVNAVPPRRRVPLQQRLALLPRVLPPAHPGRSAFQALGTTTAPASRRFLDVSRQVRRREAFPTTTR